MNTENKLPEDFKQRWVAALRSGEYKQGYQRLCKSYDGEYRYCCLGVACVVGGITDPFGGAICDEREKAVVPEVLHGTAWDNTPIAILTGMNDRGVPFSEIADWIEQNL